MAAGNEDRKRSEKRGANVFLWSLRIVHHLVGLNWTRSWGGGDELKQIFGTVLKKSESFFFAPTI